MRWKSFCISFFLLIPIIFWPSLSAGEISVYGQVPDFVFQDQNEKETRLSDFTGRVWIADFIFTRCQGMCPLMSGRMAILQEQLVGSGVKLVSFSVDPEHDTPEILNEYAKRFKAGDNWLFLTGGTKDQIWDFIQKEFQLGVADSTEEERKAGAEPVMHSSRFVLVDRKGEIVGYYDTEEPGQLEKIKSDALNLLNVRVLD